MGGTAMGSEKPWYVPGKWSVSNYNWADGVRKQMPNLPKKIEIRDVTLREVDDQMGLYLTLEDKVKLALKASEVGVKELDIGGPNLLPHQGEVCRAVRKAFDKAGIDKSVTRISGRYFGLAKDHKHEIDVIMGAGATDVQICHDVTQHHRGQGVRRTACETSGSCGVLPQEIWCHHHGRDGRDLKNP